MAYETVHLHSNRLNSDSSLLLIAIPAVVFVIVLGLFVWRFEQKEMAAGTSQTAVLGEESEKGQ